MVLPMAGILVVYAFKMPDIQRRWTGAEAALAAATSRTPLPAQTAAEQGRVADLNRQLADVQKQIDGENARWHELENTRKNDSLARIQTIEGVTALLNRHQLTLVDGSPAESTDAARLPKSLDRVVKLLSGKQGEFKPHVWRVRFVGHYADVMQALEELQDAQPLAIPIHLQMAEARLTTAVRGWTLYLWI